MQKAIAILYQGRKRDTTELAHRLAPQLITQGYEARVIDIREEGDVQADERLNGCSVALVLGGDGTILHAARLCAPINVPVLGVNFGRVGFLTELEPADVPAQLPFYLNGDSSVWLDQRAMLHAGLEQNGEFEEFLALNDVVIARGNWPRVVEIYIWMDENFYNKTYADGLILSTATGSTAYNMAVGGPLLHPQVESCVLTPIAPHLAFDRSLILPPEARVKLQIFTGTQDGVFSADGQRNRVIKNGATITVHRSQYTARFLRRRPPTHFYQIISTRLREDS